MKSEEFDGTGHAVLFLCPRDMLSYYREPALQVVAIARSPFLDGYLEEICSSFYRNVSDE